MNLVANSLIALGASPIMACALDEVAEISAQANALCLNIGVLTPRQLTSMLTAGQEAGRLGLPIVLDPVGAGVSGLRRQACRSLLRLNIRAIRGNASEIMALDGLDSRPWGHGVDAAHRVRDACAAARRLAHRYNLLVALTGEEDFIVDGESEEFIQGGHKLMSVVSGMGCALSGLLAAWLTVENNAMTAARLCLRLAGRCGEEAAASAAGPGRFATQWLDRLYPAG
jgi:hydroxyethylthiazole kinase